jgi:putative ABC transport system permease protein
MKMIWHDIRYGVRMLVKKPGFTVIVILILAIGIGVNTVIFSVVNAVMLRPLPFANPGRVVQILTQFKEGSKDPYNNISDCIEIQKRNHVFEKVAAISPAYFLDMSSEEPRGIGVARVPASFFSLLGVQPFLGRGFLPEEELPGHDHVVVLSHKYWTEHYSANEDILGQDITLQEGTWTRDGMTFKAGVYTIVGVMPADFWCLDQRSLWVPLVLTAEQLSRSATSRDTYLIARLRPNVRLEQAQAEINVIGRQLMQERPRVHAGHSFLLVLPQEHLVADVRYTLWVLLGIVGFVLAIVCANVGNMFLARSLGRQREMAVRLALGARRLRLIRQYLTESLLLSLVGGLCGLFLTVFSLGLIKAVLPYDMPRVNEIRIDGCVLSFTMAVSILVGILIGFVPVLRIKDMDTKRILQRSNLAVRGGALNRGLLVSEIALSLVLLIGAGLMIRSFWRLTSLDLGFDPKNVLVADVDPRDSIFPEPQLYFPALLDQVRRVSGVQMAALGDLPLFGSRSQNSFSIPGREVSSDGQGPSADVITIDEGYFRALRIALLQGRFLAENDRPDSEPVIVINKAFARRYFPNVSAVSQTITCWEKTWRIIGIVADVRPKGFRSDIAPTMYFSYRQTSRLSQLRLIVRTDCEPLSVLKSIRRALITLTPHRPVAQIRTIKEILRKRVAPMRFNMQLLSIFAGLALVIAAMGVYGLMAFFVSQRTQEIGIRMALGARSSDVLRSILREGFKLTLIGLAIGMSGAFAATRILHSLLYDISPVDTVTFVSMSLFLAGVAILASYIPARRAARIDPMEALRYE